MKSRVSLSGCQVSYDHASTYGLDQHSRCCCGVPAGTQVLADRPVRIVTSPQRLLDVIRLRQQQQQQQLQGAVQAGQVAVIHVEEQLPSGETLHQVLSELSEDVKEFDQHVYSRMSRRDLRGRF